MMHILAIARLYLAFQAAEAFLDQGIGLLEKGRFADAAAFLTQAIEKNPKLAEAHYLLGLIRQERGDRDLALQSFRSALNLDPRHAPAQARLAEVLTYVARASESGYPEAAAACRRALALNPSDADSHFHLAWIEAALGRHGEATTHYRTALNLQPKYPGASIGLAKALLELRQENAALALLLQLVRDEPKNPDAHLYYGVALSRKDRCADAVSAFEKTVALRPATAQAHYLLGNCYRKLGQDVAATRALAKYRELQSASAKLQQARFQAAAAHKHLQAGQLEEAIVGYHASLAMDDDPNVAIDLAVALMKNGAPHQVPELLQPIAESSPLAAYTLALAYRDLNRSRDAESLLTGALKAKPDFAEAHYLLGAIYFAAGRTEAARHHLGTAAKLRPDNPAFRTR
ncbi:MAG: tetratricopeptide repeat protein [Bryobacterales bacterium]|nr:tetratricopeptide repeat protein [Bryobacterales bacterium]